VLTDGGTDLLDVTAFENDDAIASVISLGPVVGHVDDRFADGPVQPLDFGTGRGTSTSLKTRARRVVGFPLFGLA